MAVIQISRIQVRRGLQEDLPQLASGEFGWSVDQRRLWIGNGTLQEGAPSIGNTEILTNNSDVLAAIESYTYQGRESGYVSQTGLSSNSPVRRTLQNKFDDFVNFRDFIRAQDVANDDYAVSLQRAVDQVFPKDYFNQASVRRVLRIPAGVWTISAGIKLPPYACLQGDGISSTTIRLIYGNDPVISFKDSRGNSGASIDLLTSVAPFQIALRDLTLETTRNNHVVKLESCHNISFDRVGFQGSIANPVTPGTETAAVRILDTVTPVHSVIFNSCEFSNSIYGIWASGDVSSVTINTSKFNTLYQGAVAKANVTSPRGIRIMSSEFDQIATEAIYAQDSSSITSAFNYYKSVGLTNGSQMNTGTATYPVLRWNTSDNYSISELFARTLSQQQTTGLIALNLSSNVSPVSQATTVGSIQNSPGQKITLSSNTSANIGSTILSTLASATMEYSIKRNGIVRVGVMHISHNNGQNVVFTDDYSESADTGVTFQFLGNTVSNSVVLNYSVSSGPGNAEFAYAIRSFI
jgi:hypothetical protein